MMNRMNNNHFFIDFVAPISSTKNVNDVEPNGLSICMRILPVFSVNEAMTKIMTHQ